MQTTRYRYAIGDIQGCSVSLQALLTLCEFDFRQDRLWVAGDMVNRGPDNVEVLRCLRNLGDRATCVLGNHDFFFLAVAAGIVEQEKDDTLNDLLAAPDLAELVDWLRFRPLFHVEDRFAMVHAGLLPQWSVRQAQELAKEVESALRQSDWKDFLRNLWGGKPCYWCDDLSGWDRLRIIVNVMCRSRFLQPDGAIDLRPKGRPEDFPALTPWYQAKNALWQTHTIIHGHWSALGFQDSGTVVALDSGCVWGGKLTAMRIEDRKVFQAK